MDTDIAREKREAPIAEVLDGLNDLLQLDHDAVGSYEIAIENLENRELATQIEGFQRDHERHIRDLNDLILSLGGEPMNEPHATAPLKQAIQQIAAKGGDEGILMAWRTNELQVSAKYDGYAHRALWWPAEAKRIVDQNALDEERHYRWVAHILGDDDPAEVGLTNRAREELARARRLGQDLRERASRAGGEAKARTVIGMTTAAERLDGFASRHADAEGYTSRAATSARKVAESLEAAASRLARPSTGTFDARAEIEIQVRRSPGKSLAALFGVGFIIGRIIR